MFRIDRHLVNLAARRSVSVDSGPGEDGAEGEQQEIDIPTAPCHVDPAVQEILDKAEETANQLLVDARIEADVLVRDAREHVEEAYMEAIQDGLEEGEKEARRLLGIKLKEDEGKLVRVLDEIYAENKRMHESLEEEIVSLALGVVKKIYHPAEEALGGVFDSLVRNALKQIKLTDNIVVHVGPAEYERFFSSGNAVFDLQGGVKAKATVLKDMSFNDGDCVIDTELETVNAGLDSQLRHIQIAFENML